MSATSDEYSEKSYRIDLITENDKEEVMEIMRDDFISSSVLCRASGIVPRNLEAAAKYIKDNCSFKAVLKSNGKIIGICLNKVIKREEKEKQEQSLYDGEVKILKFFEFMKNKSGLFDLYPEANSFLEISYLVVKNGYGGLGIGINLTKRSLDITHEKNFYLICSYCTSFYSQQISEKTGFRRIYRLNYKDYKNEENQPVFSPEEPHKAAIVYVKTLSDLKTEYEMRRQAVGVSPAKL